jgi:hypothetical protein
MNFYQYFPHLLFDFIDIPYKEPEHNAVELLRSYIVAVRLSILLVFYILLWIFCISNLCVVYATSCFSTHRIYFAPLIFSKSVALN